MKKWKWCWLGMGLHGKGIMWLGLRNMTKTPKFMNTNNWIYQVAKIEPIEDEI